MNSQFLRYFLAPNLAKNLGSEDYWRMLLCVVALLLTVFFSVPALFLYTFVLDNKLFFILTCVIILAALGQLVLIRFVGSLRFSAVVFLIWQSLMTTGVAFFLGGITSVVTGGFFSPPLIAWILLGTRAMAWVLCLTVLELIVLTVLAVMGISMATPFDSQAAPIVNAFISFALLLSILASFYYLDRVRSKAYKDLQDERDSVQLRVHEATNNLETQNAALQQALKDVEKANLLKDEFLRNISHEIRTPMTSILGFSEILASRINADADDNVFVEQIIQSANNLMGIFSNIISLAKIEAGEIHIAPTLVGTRYLVDYVKEQVGKQALFKGLDLQIRTAPNFPDYLKFEGNHTRHIIVYLAENAVKFTEHGSVFITFSLREQVTATTVLQFLSCEIKDTGIGIAKEYVDNLFIPFHQQDGSKTRSVGGLGLGLAITKRLVDALEGRICVASTVGVGTCFTVEIPCDVYENQVNRDTNQIGTQV